jgi:divalent metal cation (Fe/Co/Zn/Cd) transporter
MDQRSNTMSDWQRDEKEEKQEKEEEKHEKGEWRSDRLDTLSWAAILIWIGLVLLANSLEIFALAESWPAIPLGAGIIVLIEALARLALPQYRRPTGGHYVLAIVLIAVGLGNWLDWSLIWPVALILIGLGILARGFLQRRE